MLATQHLIEQGHKEIELIKGLVDWWEATERTRYNMGCASVEELERFSQEGRQGAESQARTTVLQPKLIVRESSIVK